MRNKARSRRARTRMARSRIIFRAESYGDESRFTLPANPVPRLHDVEEALPGKRIKAQNHDGQWFDLCTDRGLDEAIAAANGGTVPLFCVAQENEASEGPQFTQCPRAWVNYNQAKQTAKALPDMSLSPGASVTAASPMSRGLSSAVGTLGNDLNIPLALRQIGTEKDQEELRAYLKARERITQMDMGTYPGSPG